MAKKLYDRIIEESKKGNVILATSEGLGLANLKALANQPVEGLLYDLNRTEAGTLALMEDDPKWVNDYAVAQVIRELKRQLEERRFSLDDVLILIQHADNSGCPDIEWYKEVVERFEKDRNGGVKIAKNQNNDRT